MVLESSILRPCITIGVASTCMMPRIMIAILVILKYFRIFMLFGFIEKWQGIEYHGDGTHDYDNWRLAFGKSEQREFRNDSNEVK